MYLIKIISSQYTNIDINKNTVPYRKPISRCFKIYFYSFCWINDPVGPVRPDYPDIPPCLNNPLKFS